MDRGVDDLHVGVALDRVGGEGEGLDVVEILFVDILADDLDEVFVGCELDLVDRSDCVDVGDRLNVVGSDHLSAVAPVCLVAVVFLRVVACSHHYAALASEFADSVAHLGHGTAGIEEIHLDAVGREDVGGEFGELAGVVAHVVTDSHRDLREILEAVVEVVGEALGCSAYGVDVHAVGAYAHDSAESAGAEFEVFIECVDELCLVFIVKHSLNSLASLLVILGAEPFLGLRFDGFQ